ncbi:MAG: nucleotidyltransferase domain-containing protein [Armatimonadetes bacterium]|nr:nucleotidyltransferase domain-containing protein [Armatimonadota bacterium]
MARRSATTTRRGGRSARPPAPPADWASLRPRVTPELLESISRRIVEQFDPERIVLFGSYAHGRPTLDSDVDLLVVMESDEPFLPRVRRVRAAASVPFLPMDIIVATPAEVRERLDMGDTFMAGILKEGILLYERGGRVGAQSGGRLPTRD